MVNQASSIAKVLANVILQQRLYTEIQGKKHVRVEGWATLGSMLGILPKERSVVEHPDGSFEAFVDLVSVRDGRVVGGGSALCSIDEKRWGNAERYARRSMAVTRATGKAYRLGFAWVMALAGYEATPYEEMPDESPNHRSAHAPRSNQNNGGAGESRKPNAQRSGASQSAGGSRPAESQKPTPPPELFSKATEGHLERLGEIVMKLGVTDPGEQAKVIELMEGKPMLPSAVNEAIKTAKFQHVVDAEVF